MQSPTELLDRVESILNGTGEHKKTPRTASAGVATRKRNTTSAVDPVDEDANKPPVQQNPKGLMIALVAVTVVAIIGAVIAIVSSGRKEDKVAARAAAETPRAPAQPTAVSRPATVETAAAATRADIDERLKAAQTWDAAHPDEWAESLSRYKVVLDEARNSSAEFRKQITQCMDTVKGRQQAAIDGAWKILEAQINEALAKDGYDAALKACEKKADIYAEDLTPRQDEKARAMRVDAEGKIDAILTRADAKGLSNEDALKILTEADALKYGPGSQRIAMARAQHSPNETVTAAAKDGDKADKPKHDAPESAKAPETAMSDAMWNQTLTTFDKEYLEQGNFAGARDAVAKTLKQYPSDSRAVALLAIITSYDDLKQREKDILAHLAGAQLEWPVFPNKLTKVTVKKSDEASFTFECSMGPGANMSKTVKVADLNAEDRARVFGTATPTNDPQRVALALLNLQKGKEDFPKAADLLKSASGFPLTPHYSDRIKSVEVAAQELDAEKDWAAIESQAKTLKNERDGRALLDKIAAFETEHNNSAYIKIMGDKINLLKNNAQLAGVASEIANADFETGGLDRWQVRVDPTVGEVENVKNGELSKRCVSIKGSRENSFISQQIRVTPGEKYSVTATIQIVENGKDEKGGARLTINDAKGKPLDEARKNTPRYSWEHLEAKFTAKSDLVTIELGAFYPGTSSTATVRFDNVKITKAK